MIDQRAKQLLAAALFSLLALPARAETPESRLTAMLGCWVSEAFTATSLLTDDVEPDNETVVMEKMLLKVVRIPDADLLVFGYLYEWNKDASQVLGPLYQNGAYNPAARYLTFGSPNGGLDHVSLSNPDQILYVHTKSATKKSAMSVRWLKRLPCGEADMLEAALRRKQGELAKND